MSFVFTAKVATHPIDHLLSGQEPRWFNDRPFAMHPFRLNRIQPGALGGQETRQDAHALAFLLDLPIVRSDPGRTARLRCQEALSHTSSQTGRAVSCSCHNTTPGIGRDRADRATRDEAQPDLLGLGCLAHQQAVTRQGFGIGIIGRDCLFDQVQGLLRLAPGMQLLAARADSTRSHPHSPAPKLDGSGPGGSGGRVGFFSQVPSVGAGDPAFGPLPLHAQFEQGLPDRFATDFPLGQALLEADLGGQIQRPQAGVQAEGAWAAVQEGAQALGGLGGEGRVRACGGSGSRAARPPGHAR